MRNFILAPGPTQCDQNYLDLLSHPVMYHRSLDFHKLYKNTRNILKKIIELENGQVLLLTCSGTGAMEASVSNFFNKGNKVLVISIGHFGDRFTEICNTYELDTHVLKYPIGQTYNLEEVKNFIDKNNDLKGVFVTHHETSSGVLNKLKPIGQLVKSLNNCLFIVDSISGLMVHPMKMDEWGVDCLLAASQKGFQIPPGIAITALSKKAIRALENSESPRYYNDFLKYLNMLDIDETPFTPNVALIEALYESCKHIYNDIKMENYHKYYENLREYLSQELKSRGLNVDIVKPQNRGNVLVMFEVKPGWNAKTIHDELDKKGYIIATGFGENKTKMLRVGVIGNVKKTDIDKFLTCFDQTIKELYG